MNQRREHAYRLSPTQEGMLFHHLQEGAAGIEALRVDIGILDLFRKTTVSGLARYLQAISDENRPGGSSEEPRAKRSGRRRRLVNRKRRDVQRRDRRPTRRD